MQLESDVSEEKRVVFQPLEPDSGTEARAMNEHDDDLEAEVEEDAEFEKEEFPIPTDEEETEVSDEEGAAQMEDDIDPDKSEI